MASMCVIGLVVIGPRFVVVSLLAGPGGQPAEACALRAIAPG